MTAGGTLLPEPLEQYSAEAQAGLGRVSVIQLRPASKKLFFRVKLNPYYITSPELRVASILYIGISMRGTI